MIEFKKSVDSNGILNGVLSMEGELTIINAVKIKDALLEAMSAVDRLEINLENGQEMDLSFLQIICAAQLMAASKKKTIVFAGKCPDSFPGVVADAGFGHVIACARDKGIQVGKTGGGHG